MIYLDNSATTQPTQAVVDAMAAAMREGFYNPSSLYAQAVAAEKQMEACRASVQQSLGAGRVLFTSGGTEANNLAILGALAAMRGRGRVLYSAGEHACVVEACVAAESMGFHAEELPLDAQGKVDLDALAAQLGDDVSMVCLMQVNNEMGAIQPLAEVAQLMKRHCPQAWLHVDAVQGFLRHPLNPSAIGASSVAMSAHKIHGPKGVGALWLAQGTKLSPRVFGGGQESGLRPGTENTPGIAGFLAAQDEYPKNHAMRSLKLQLWHTLAQAIPPLRVNGPRPDSPLAADHILNVSFAPVRAQTMLHALEGEGVLVGNGSACSSKKARVSRVLRAMRVPDEQAQCAIRFSLNPYLTQDEMDAAAQAVLRCYERLKGFVRR